MRRNILAIVKATGLCGVGLVVCSAVSGCLVAGYTSGGGWWVWPGSLVVTLILVLLFALGRR
jgi:hypothetical protein